MNEQYTYIEIRKTAPSVFEIYDNTSPNNAVSSSSYAGRIEPFRGIYNNDSSFTITTKTGHPIYNHQLWSIFRYVDAINGANSFNPVSGIDLHRKLTARGFYMRSDILVPVDTIDQDNKIKTISVNFQVGETPTQQNIVDKINSGTQFTISEKENLLIEVRLPYISAPLVISFRIQRYLLVNKGKDTYGQGGTQLNSLDIKLVYNSPSAPTTSDIMDDPSTQVINYTLAPGQTLSNWLNTQPQQTIQEQDEGLRVFTDGTDTYLFTGDGGSYGIGGLQSNQSQFNQFFTQNEIDPPPPTNQILQSIKVTTETQDMILQDNRLIGMDVHFTNVTGTVRTPDMFIFDPVEGVLKDYPVDINEIHIINFIKP